MHLIGIVLGALLVLAAVVIARHDIARLLFDADAPAATSAPSPNTRASANPGNPSTNPASPSAGPGTRPTVSAAASPPRPAAASPARPQEEPARTAANVPAAPKPAVTFDVLRIDPGASVFAGQAPPNSKVTVLADGRPIAEAKADESGAWVAVIERDFAPAEYEFSLRAKSADGRDVSGQRLRTAVAPAARAVAAPRMPDTVAARVAAPAPITFLYNDISFTKEGQLAVARLAEYLISQRPKAVSLTGHADERGSDSYNVELSRQRLGVVANYLRNSGFAGSLELIPKGSTEPYAGVDRQRLSNEEAYQLDRRVELRLAR